MAKNYKYPAIVLVIVVLSTGILIYALRDSKVEITQWHSVGRPADIHPDYNGTVLPPNIAPLNFLVQEAGSHYFVKIYSQRGKPIEIFSRSPKITIPQGAWHKLLNINREQQLNFDVFVKTEDEHWNRFEPITNRIANEPIDPYLVYRKIRPVYSTGETSIHQRNLQSYDDRPVLSSKSVRGVCINCHTFCKNRTDKMFLGTRSKRQGSFTVFVQDGRMFKLQTKFGYTCWHPSGKLAVYSVNKVRQFFHFARNQVRDVVDLDSALLYYDVDSKRVKTCPKFSAKDRLETFPTWSPDGRYLYFCSAPMLWTDRNKLPPDRYREVKYDLQRISYDPDRDQWGQLETVLSARDTGLSILQPKISPDGRWLIFCMCDYSCWASYRPSSDLYIMDLRAAIESGSYDYRRLDCNSDQSETWTSWSSNSRWIAFSSKKGNGLFTRTYLSYIDNDGNAHKPILLPEKDPEFFDSHLWTHSVPELVTEAVKVKGEKLASFVRSARKIPVDLPITMATPGARDAPVDTRWQERE
jgi:hypothetical protein